MPHVVSQDGTRIFYNVYGHAEDEDGSPLPRALLIMGFAASHITWAPQLADLLKGACLACLDNRGVGASDAPRPRAAYSTALMAADCMALLRALGWDRAHVVGHSMGAMVAAKLAAIAPKAVASLTLISSTGGGWQAVPLSPRPLWLGLQLLLTHSVAKRAALDVQFHYSKRTLEQREERSKVTRHELLLEEYIAAASLGDHTQTEYGMAGQLRAVWKHHLGKKEVCLIREAGIPCLVIHGRDDIVAAPRHGAALARRLHAPFLLLDGAHFVFREQHGVVNSLLRALMSGGSFVEAAHLVRGRTEPVHVPLTGLTASFQAWSLEQEEVASVRSMAGDSNGSANALLPLPENGTLQQRRVPL